jgi:hypothetical protein
VVACFDFFFPLNTQSVIETIYGKAEKLSFEYKISFFLNNFH